jgi:hypothetical protein
MQDNTKQELDNLMNNFGQGLDSLAQKKAEEKAAQDQFLKDFEKIKHEIIWPTIIEVGNQLNSYGHDYHISEEQEFVDATASYTPASITLNIYPATIDKAYFTPDSTPYVSFVGDKYSKKVSIVVSTMLPGQGGTIGTHCECALTDVNKEFVEQELVAVLKKSLILNNNAGK